MFSPKLLSYICRFVLAIALAAYLDYAFFKDPLAIGSELFLQLWAGYCGLLLLLTAFPWHRRSDLTRTSILIGAVISMMRVLTAHDPVLFLGFAAFVVGTTMAYIATYVDWMRRLTRTYSEHGFEIIGIEERRKSHSAHLKSAKSSLNRQSID